MDTSLKYVALSEVCDQCVKTLDVKKRERKKKEEQDQNAIIQAEVKKEKKKRTRVWYVLCLTL